jgi:selenide, water dikinase
MAYKKFIDYAKHGGCSAKLDAPRLRDLLAPLPNGTPGFADAGIAELPSGQKFASSVDVVLPMIDDPEIFGRIVVAHVLSDLYAVGAKPLFALNVLSVPKVPEEEDERVIGDTERREREVAIDGDVQSMLMAANEAMQEKGVTPVGGHSLLLEALIFGLSATGVLPNGGGVSNDDARPGDVLVLTKRVGTSIATKSWKGEEATRADFEDVVEGMLSSNEKASTAMLTLSRCACTDITGFGLMGHLHNMLLASDAAAAIEVKRVPIYDSVKSILPQLDSDHNTRIFHSNVEFVDSHVRNIETLDIQKKLVFFDAQISGGLLIAVPPAEADNFLEALGKEGCEAHAIGEIIDGPPGEITLG